MTEWSLLAKQLEECLREWPYVLIPIVTDYVRVRMYEWGSTVVGGIHVSCDRQAKYTYTKWQLNVEVAVGFPCLFMVSKCGLHLGPCRWGFDIEFSEPQNRDQIIGIGIWDFFYANRPPFMGIRLTQKPSGVVNITCDNGDVYSCAVHQQNKFTIYVHRKDNNEIHFDYLEYGYLRRPVGMCKLLKEDFADFRPAAYLTNVRKCLITFIE